jgi:hypothetical protein
MRQEGCLIRKRLLGLALKEQSTAEGDHMRVYAKFVGMPRNNCDVHLVSRWRFASLLLDFALIIGVFALLL